MSNFQTAAETGAQHAQRDVNVVPGQILQRGTSLVLVESVKGDAIAWIDSTGELWSGTIQEFRRLALTVLGDVKVREVAYLDDAWSTASARNIPRDIRALALSRTLRRAPDDASHLTVLRWSRSLSLGLEPTRRTP